MSLISNNLNLKEILTPSPTYPTPPVTPEFVVANPNGGGCTDPTFPPILPTGGGTGFPSEGEPECGAVGDFLKGAAAGAVLEIIAHLL